MVCIQAESYLLGRQVTLKLTHAIFYISLRSLNTSKFLSFFFFFQCMRILIMLEVKKTFILNNSYNFRYVFKDFGSIFIYFEDL